jgi:hypothetical protein
MPTPVRKPTARQTMLVFRKTIGVLGIALLIAAALWLRYTSFTLQYRLVWVTDRKVQEQLPVKVPEARFSLPALPLRDFQHPTAVSDA